MGRAITLMDQLPTPLAAIQERLNHLEGDSQLIVEHRALRVVLFIEANARLETESGQSFDINSGDLFITANAGKCIYSPRSNATECRLHTLIIYFQHHLKGDFEALKKKSNSSVESESDGELFVCEHFSKTKLISHGINSHLRNAIDRLRSEPKSLIAPLGARMRASSIAWDILVEVARIQNKNEQESIAQDSSGRRDLVGKIENYLMDNIDKTILLKDVAWHVNLSEEHLARTFKKLIGKTVFQYLAELRLEMAKDLLISSDASVSSIAKKCGYSSLSLLGRNFKTATGMTPVDYRVSMNTKIVVSKSKMESRS